MNLRFSKQYLLILSVAITLFTVSCIKENEPHTNGDEYNEPELKVDDKWIYLTNNNGVFVNRWNGNQRPVMRKWIATNITANYASSVYVPSLNDTLHTLNLTIENTNKDTRFVDDNINPGGKEKLSIQFKKFTTLPPQTGNFKINIDNENGYCWFYVYNAADALIDSVFISAMSETYLTIDQWTFVDSTSYMAKYKMSGSADLDFIRYNAGTLEDPNIYSFKCKFNNIEIIFSK